MLQGLTDKEHEGTIDDPELLMEVRLQTFLWETTAVAGIGPCAVAMIRALLDQHSWYCKAVPHDASIGSSCDFKTVSAKLWCATNARTLLPRMWYLLLPGMP